jgi:hypothetical protein
MFKRIGLLSVCFVSVLGAQANANTTTGDRQPLVRYDAASGKLSITADVGNINSIVVPMSDIGAWTAADVSMAVGNLPSFGAPFNMYWDARKEGDHTLDYTDPQFVSGGTACNLTSALGDRQIALLPTSLSSVAFGQVSVTFSDYGSAVTTGVTVMPVPEPGVLCLLATAVAMVGGCAMARRRRAV